MIRFIPFPRVLVLCEMQSVSSRVWTCVTMSISYNDNHYTTKIFLLEDICFQNNSVLSTFGKFCFYLFFFNTESVILLNHHQFPYFTNSKIFSTSIRWWFLTGVWATASLLKSPGLFSIFWPIWIMLQFGWSLLILLFPSPPVPVPNLSLVY